ncbi:MAG: GNAT family N-acetyltransferase [Bacillota bacterium]|nr:GNAT family N-acetyltransferase [Bacillota bacterium]
MQRDYEDNDKKFCVLDQFMIDKQHQGKGFGRAAMKLWLSIVKNKKKYDSIILCYIEGDEAARNLYSDLGFNHNGDVDEDEIQMEYNLK